MTLAPQAKSEWKDAHVHPPGFRARRGLNWFTIGLLYATFYMCRYNFRFAGPGMCEEFHFGTDQIAYLAAWFSLAYGTGQLINGLFSDRIGGRATMVRSSPGIAPEIAPGIAPGVGAADGGGAKGGWVMGGAVTGGTVCGGAVRGGKVCGGSVCGGTVLGGWVWGGCAAGCAALPAAPAALRLALGRWTRPAGTIPRPARSTSC